MLTRERRRLTRLTVGPLLFFACQQEALNRQLMLMLMKLIGSDSVRLLVFNEDQVEHVSHLMEQLHLAAIVLLNHQLTGVNVGQDAAVVRRIDESLNEDGIFTSANVDATFGDDLRGRPSGLIVKRVTLRRRHRKSVGFCSTNQG